MKPVASGSVTIALPLLDVEEEFVRALGEDDGTTIERLDEGEFVAVSRALLVRVVQEFRLVAEGDAATQVQATIWVEPAIFGWLARRMGRRRMQAGVDLALSRMAYAATGEPEFGPEDFAGEDDPAPR